MTSSLHYKAPVSRRAFIGAAGVALAAPIILRSRQASAKDDPVVLATWGGLVAKAVKDAWADPFTKETGIPVTVAEGPDLAKVKAQIQTGNIEWDVLDLPGSMALSGAKLGFWEPIDTGIVDTSNLLLASSSPDLVRMYTYAGGVAWDSKRNPDGTHPRDVPEYFDVARFPGSRTLRARVSETLEMALVGSGVPADKLYPLDIERGFKALDTIKPHIRKWVSETAQMTALLQNREVDFSYVYTSRVRAAQEGGIPMEMSMGQCVIGSIYYGVVKGSPRREAAMRFINFAAQPAQMAAFCTATTGIPNVKGARELMDESVQKWVPDLNDPKHIIVSDAYWSDHYEELNARFKEWLLI
jgi:putative spermidine/putrescine transport system substrate-binding protein